MEYTYNKQILKLRDQAGWTNEKWAELVDVDLDIVNDIATGDLELDEEMYHDMERLMRCALHPDLVFFDRTIVLAISNHKGGCGKTTSSLAIAERLSEMGYKVLLIDTDEQHNATNTYLANKMDEAEKRNLYTSIVLGTDLREQIIESDYGMDFIAADGKMASVEAMLLSQSTRTKAPDTFKKIFHNLKESREYDFVIIDMTIPLNLTNEAILGNATHLLIVSEGSCYNLDGVSEMYAFYEQIKADVNPDLNLIGLLLNKVVSRKLIVNAAKQTLEDILPGLTLNSNIRVDASVEAAQWKEMPLGVYNKRSNAWKDFCAATDELLERLKKEETRYQ